MAPAQPEAVERSADRGTEEAVDVLEARFTALFEVHRQRVKRRAAAIDPELQPSGYRTLMTLVDLGPTGASAVAERLGFDRSVVSRQLHQLQELGLVTRDRDEHDGRAIVIRATPSAVARVQALNCSDRDEFRARLGAWSHHDLAELDRLLSKLADD